MQSQLLLLLVLIAGAQMNAGSAWLLLDVFPCTRKVGVLFIA